MKVYKQFYNEQYPETFRSAITKYNRLTSKFTGRFDTLIDFFERKALHILYTSGFVINPDTAAFMAWRGFAYLNAWRINNKYLRANIGDLLNILPGFRNNLHEGLQETYNSFKKKYLVRLYKLPFFNIISKFIAWELSMLGQARGRLYAIDTLSATQMALNSVSLLGPQIPLQDMNLFIMNIKTTGENFFKGLLENPLVCARGSIGRKLVAISSHLISRKRKTILLCKSETALKRLYKGYQQRKLQSIRNSLINRLIYKDIITQN